MCSVCAASDDECDMLGRRSLPLFGALPLAVLALAGCGGNASHALPTTDDGRPASLGVANTGLGDVLVDRQGRTLYLFARPRRRTSEALLALTEQVNSPTTDTRCTPS